MLLTLTEIINTPCTTTKAGKGCPKCGILRTNKRSCCGSGGAWFKKCGNEGDPKYEHTWAEGVAKCEIVFDYYLAFHGQPQQLYQAQAQGTETMNAHESERGATNVSVTDEDIEGFLTAGDIESISDSSCPDELTLVIGLASFFFNALIM